MYSHGFECAIFHFAEFWKFFHHRCVQFAKGCAFINFK